MRRPKRLALMMAAAFVMMPFPALLNAEASQSTEAQRVETVVPAQVPVNRAGVAINGAMKAAIDPVRIGDLYYVPFKDIARILDYDHIMYNTATKTYRATDGSVTVSVTIGGTQAMKGDERVTIQPPRFINGTTYVSIDAVSAAFNVFAFFKPENGSIQIQMPARQYRVQPGDTLWKVAQAHHTTILAVQSANGLRSDELVAGQVLRLPAEALTREMDPVAPGASAPAPAPASVQAEAAPVASVSAKAQAIIATGKQYLGRPYKFGAKPADAPRYMDCSSFLQYIFKQHGITLPRDSRQQSQVGTRVTALQPGDLLFFKYPERYSDGRVGHVGMYIGNGQMLHTVPKTGVTITNYQKSSYWKRNYLYAKRVIR